MRKDPPPSKERSAAMRSIRTKGTAPEQCVCRVIDELGIPYERNVPRLPGTPDIVLMQVPVALFVHGCFWHGHRGCSKGLTAPKTRTKFWNTKIQTNVNRDRANKLELRRKGWSVLTVWECRCKHTKEIRRRVLQAIQRRLLRRGSDGD